MENATPATAHLFIVNHLHGEGIAKLFSTHPPIRERIERLNRLAAGFEGPLIVLVNAAETDLRGKGRMLVPVNGTQQSRRAAETALALARASGAPVQALFVSQTDGHARTRVREEAVLREMVELGERYNVTVATRISKWRGRRVSTRPLR